MPKHACLFMTLVAIVAGCHGLTASAMDREKTAAAKHIVFVIGEREYDTPATLRRFAESRLRPQGFRYTFVEADDTDKNLFPGLEVLGEADLMFLSVRRRALSPQQMRVIRAHFAAGKPMIGIRTSSHAFALRDGEPGAGHVQWTDFDREVLGCTYQGHLRNNNGTDIMAMPRATGHEILAGIDQARFHSGGSLYRSLDLGPKTHVLLRGVAIENGQPIEMPVAWTNAYGKSRIFYTSLGHRTEFEDPSFTKVLTNAVYWSLQLPNPEVGTSDASKDSPNASEGRNRYQVDLAANDQVDEMIRSFPGRGEVGDNSQPTPAERSAETFRVSDDLELELVANEPHVKQPLFLNWDHRGRMWVVQYLQYPFPAGLKVVKYDQHLRAVFDKVPPPPPNHFVGEDKITVLEDADGDGTFESTKDVITGLNIATSVVTGRGGIWVMNPPYLLFYPDADRDDVPDGDPEVHLSGFGLEDTHSVANSIRWGPDGWLYGANGSTTTATVNSAVTRNVHFKGQCIWRYHPDTKVFEIFAEGGGNTFSLEIDSKGRVFSGTNNGATRGMHYVQGGYGKKTWGKHGPLTNPHALGYFQHMRHRGDDERFSQTFLIYEGGTFPQRLHQAVISGNALHNRILASRLLPDTSTYRTEDMPPIVLSSDRWFRPVCVNVGPDGAVYLADWYDSRLTHVDPRDNWHKSSGRIYRLRAKDAVKTKPFNLEEESSEELIERFGHPNKWFRQNAVRVLGERKDMNVVPALRRIALDESDGRSLEALWALNLLGQLDTTLATELSRHADPHVRRWTVRLLGDARRVSDSLAERLAELAETEPYVQVRSQLASTAKRLPARHGLPIARALLSRDEDVEDLHLPLLLWWAIEDKAVSDRNKVLAMLSDTKMWSLPMVRQHLLHRLMQRYAMTATSADLDACARLLEMAPGKREKQKLMTGFMAAYDGRSITGLPKGLSRALAEYRNSLGQTEIALALRLGDIDAVSQALETISDDNADLATRMTYIEILGQIDQPRAVPVLLKLLSRKGSNNIKRVALQALLSYDDPVIGETIVKRYHSTLPDEQNVRGTAQRVLAGRASWALEFVNEVDQWRISAESVPLQIVRQMSLHQDENIDRMIAKHWGKLGGPTSDQTTREINRIGALLRSGSGDLQAGRQIFQETCGKCHKLFGNGGSAGPDLTTYERTNLDSLLMAVIDPGAAIHEDYTSFAIVTTDGRTLTGLVQDSDTRKVTLRDANGQAVLISREDIDAMRALPTSMMPDGLLSKMTDQQIRHLFSYLISRAPTVAETP